MGDDQRLPPPVDGIEFHFCRNVSCQNFGCPPTRSNKWAKVNRQDTYRLSGGKSSPTVLICNLCGTSVPVKSNAALAEELRRMWKPFIESEPSCPSPDCVCSTSDGENGGSPVRSHGTTKSGQRRYYCTRCKKTFTAQQRVARKPRRKGLDEQILVLLLNKMPMRRICEVAEISAAVLYNQIIRSHELAVSFSAAHEKRLQRDLVLPRVYLAVDRQEYVFNWGSSLDRRNVVLRAIASSDNATGYVFGVHLDFDSSMEPELVERQAILANDYDKPYHFRQFARVWLQREYRDRYHTLRRLSKRQGRGTIADDIVQSYKDDALSSEVVEPREIPNQRLPSQGMQVHSEYTLYAHFWFLARLLQNVEKVRIFMDQDSGMRAACLGAFLPRVMNRTLDAFFVRIRKDLTVSQKKALKAGAERLLRMKMDELNTEDRNHATRAVMEERLQEMINLGESGDQWLMHPFPDMSEPEKAICHLTAHGGHDLNHLAALHRKASLHSIDNFFMQVRRRINLLERPVRSASAARTWYGYAAYNPSVAQRLLEIFRVAHNYVFLGDDKKTPAMRIGLSDRPYRLNELLELPHGKGNE